MSYSPWPRWAWVASLALLCAGLLAACGPRPDPQLEITGATMGTYYAVKVPRPPAGLHAETLKAGLDTVLDAVVAELSTYEPDSQLSRLNADRSADWIPISPALAAPLAEGLRLSALTEGAFDVTVGPLVNLWGFGPDPGGDQVPDAAAIAGALERVGYAKVSLREDPPALRKARGDIHIDLSALGEGVGADRMAAYLESLGIVDYMAAVAGTLRVRGRNAHGRPWGIAIEEPSSERRAVQRVLPVTDHAVSTSGDYRNFFETGGQRHSHHLDPRTGQTVAHRLASVTVVLPNAPDAAMRADGLATALIVLGETDAPALADRLGIAAYFIVREDDGFRELGSRAMDTLRAPDQ